MIHNGEDSLKTNNCQFLNRYSTTEDTLNDELTILCSVAHIMGSRQRSPYLWARGSVGHKVIEGNSGRANSGHDELKIRIFRYEQLQSAKLPLQTPEGMAQLQPTFHCHAHSFLVADQYLASLIEKYCTKNFLTYNILFIFTF